MKQLLGWVVVAAMIFTLPNGEALAQNKGEEAGVGVGVGVGVGAGEDADANANTNADVSADANAGESETSDLTKEGPKDSTPKLGDFDAGGKVRLPNGPDETGEYATFNWVAVDLSGRYFLASWANARADMPVAIIKPDDFGGQETSAFGGMSLGLDVQLPEMPSSALLPYETKLMLSLSGTYMREGAVLLSSKDFPLYTGGFQPGLTSTLDIRVVMSSLVDFSTTPAIVYQKGDEESLTGLQVPLSLILKLGSLVKVSADAGIFTGDDYSFGGDEGGRIALGGALDIKLGPVIVHGGAGVASLLTGGLYPTIRDSVYMDLNLKFAK